MRLTVLIAGAVIMALEISGSRILAPFFGSSVYVWGALIGTVLTALTLGYYLGGKLADRTTRYLPYVLIAASFYIIFIPLISFRITFPNALIASVILFVPPSVLLAMVPPMAMKQYTQELEKVGESSGNIYALSSIGSITGTFLATYVLIPNIGTTTIIYLLGFITAAAAMMEAKKKSIIYLSLMVVILLFPMHTLVVNNIFAKAYYRVAYETVYETDTAYYHLIVGDKGNERVLFLDGIMHSSIEKDNPNITTFEYPEYFHIPMPRDKVLFIGGGALSSPKDFLATYPDVEVDVVELDPRIIEVSRQYFNVTDNPRLDVHVGDGRQYLQNTDEQYDYIVLDAYTGTYIPFHVMTTEFFSVVEEHLEEDGAIAMNMITPLSGELSTLFYAEYNTLADYFDYIQVYPVDSPRLSGNVVIIASDRPIASEEEPYHITPRDTPVLTDSYAPVNYINPLLAERLES